MHHARLSYEATVGPLSPHLQDMEYYIMEYKTEILMTGFVTHDVQRFVLRRPKDFSFKPGQATELAIDRPGWTEERRPFTMTNLEEEQVLEFTIKRYPEHQGVTDLLHRLVPGEALLLHDAWGTIRYRGAGTFIAGGAGVTPFIAILRRLQRDRQLDHNVLLLSNKTEKDVILEQEFRNMLGDRFVSTLTRGGAPGHLAGHIDSAFIHKHAGDINRPFYICGPEKFVKDIKSIVANAGASSEGIVIEK